MDINNLGLWHCRSGRLAEKRKVNQQYGINMNHVLLESRGGSHPTLHDPVKKDITEVTGTQS